MQGVGNRVLGVVNVLECLDYFLSATSEEECEKSDGGKGEDVSEGLVERLGVSDVDGRGAGGDGEGDEAVVSLEVIGDESSVECDAPGGVVAEIEDDVFGCGCVRSEVSGDRAGIGVGRGFGIGVG
jgi:hypothetical protein